MTMGDGDSQLDHAGGREGAAASETTPLLASSLVAPGQDPDIAEGLVSDPAPAAATAPEDKPLPKTQIMLLCYSRLIEPIAFFSIFPYINQMLQYNVGLPATDVGFYSGLIESLFSLTQMLVMMFWAKAANRFGRKPVLVFSMLGVSVSTGIFGLARTLWQMILLRCLAGVFAGTIVTVRTMISEHSTARTQARAFSWFGFAGNLGIFFGPLVGGALAEPATQYPGLFGGIPFFHEYPYALPSFGVGLFGLTAVVVTALFVDETLQRRRPGKAANRSGDDEAAAGAPEQSDEMSVWKLLQLPGVAIVLYVYGHVTLLAFAFTAVIPVFWFTPVPLGGFGLTTVQISLFMALTGLSQAVWLLGVFPPLQHRIGTNGVMRVCGIAYPAAMALNPLLSMLLRAETEAGAKAFWIAAPICLSLLVGISMSFTAVQLCLNDISPSPEALGTLNALALTGSSALRSFTPALFASIYAGEFRVSSYSHTVAVWRLSTPSPYPPPPF